MNERERAESEPFYIGYLPQAPKGLQRWLRATIISLLALAAALALLLAAGFKRLPLSVFEFGQDREYTGVIRLQPYPSLLVVRNGALEQYLLVGRGKHAADVAAFASQTVKMRGSLITRAGLRMLELVPGSLEQTDTPTDASLPSEALGRFTLLGEIVDSKCYLGVMNPGHTKPHRECAVRCISGGVPPLFLARAAYEQEVALQLADAKGNPLHTELLDFVAEPIEITGQVVRNGEWLTLQADPSTYLCR